MKWSWLGSSWPLWGEKYLQLVFFGISLLLTSHIQTLSIVQSRMTQELYLSHMRHKFRPNCKMPKTQQISSGYKFTFTAIIWYCDWWILWHIAFCDYLADSRSQIPYCILMPYLILWLPYWILWLFFIQIWGKSAIFLHYSTYLQIYFPSKSSNLV